VLPDQLAILARVYAPSALLSLAVLFVARWRVHGAAGRGALPGPHAQRRRAREGLGTGWLRDCVTAAAVPLAVWLLGVVLVL